jgi:hypothetical protein
VSPSTPHVLFRVLHVDSSRRRAFAGEQDNERVFLNDGAICWVSKRTWPVMSPATFHSIVKKGNKHTNMGQGIELPRRQRSLRSVRNDSSDLNRTRRASTPVTDWLETRVTTKPTTTIMNDSQHRARIDSRKQRRQAAERRRLRAFTASDASGGGGLTEKEATKLITSSKIKNTQ